MQKIKLFTQPPDWIASRDNSPRTYIWQLDNWGGWVHAYSPRRQITIKLSTFTGEPTYYRFRIL